MKKFSIFLTVFTFVLSSGMILVAQDAEDKVKYIKDPVEKITITADGKEYTFEGEDAKVLFDKLKRTSSNSFVMKLDDEDGSNEKIIIINPEVDDLFEFEGELESGSDELNKRVKVEIEDGKKKVTVTTKENGEEKVEVYEGEEAEEYLEKNNSEHDGFFEFEIKDGGDKKIKKIKIEKKDIDSEL